MTTTPKPGLVDRRNSGSHKDMDVFTFMDSAAALYPYFEACARTGRETAEQPAPETFAALRPLGCEAEGEMLDATGRRQHPQGRGLFGGHRLRGAGTPRPLPLGRSSPAFCRKYPP